MSTSMADLGFNIDSKPMKTATSELNKMSTAAGKTERSTTGLTSATNVLKTAMVGLAGAISAREIVQLSDAWRGAENQLKQVTSSSAELAAIQSELVNISKDTRSNFESTANLYARLARSTDQMGLSQRDLLDITTTINQSFAASGATATEAAAAITQLSQGLASGALRGDEFNSVSEQAPAIMRAIADSLNMTTGELRTFAAEGGITSEIVVNALKQASDSIANDFGQTVATFGQSMEVARTNMLKFVGESTTINNAVSSAGDAVVWLTERLVDFGNILPQMAEQWVFWANDVRSVLNIVSGYFSESSVDWGNIINGSLSFMADAFYEFPSNVRAAIKIAVIEFASMADRVKAYADLMAGYLDPSTWGNSSVQDVLFNNLDATLRGISQARMDSITAILAERDASISSGESIILIEDRKRKSIDLTTAKIKASFSDVGQESGEKSAEKFVNSWDNAAQTVASGLQDALASGDWSSLGDAIGAALSTSISAIISKTITDSLAQNLTSNSSMLSQIGGAFAGPIAGAIAGAAIQIAVKELEDFFSDDFDPTEARQAAIGTGTILGSIDKKTQSIMKASEISASANAELIGINRDMLRALNSLNAGISGATSRVASGAANASMQGQSSMSAGSQVGKAGAALFGFTSFIGAFDKAGDLFGSVVDANLDIMSALTFNLLDIGSLLGGKTKKKDEGIQIIGGYIQDLVGETIVNAYETFRVKKHALDDYDTKNISQRLAGDVESQFQLVFQSIFDSVASATDILGLDVSQAMADFRIETTRISLEGLDAEEQQAALESYFGAIFDNLAESAVPFLTEFQRAGEGLGETLARVATTVQVADEAISMLGVQFTEFSYESLRSVYEMIPGMASSFDAMANEMEIIANIKAKERLIELSGGIEQFISSSSEFARNFMDDATQFEMNTDALSRALGGLGLPETREGFLELMQAQDAATVAGAENIATLLRLQGAADQYYDYLEDREEQRIQDAESASKALEQIAEDEAKAAETAARELLAGLSSAMNDSLIGVQNAINAERELASSRLSTAQATHQAAIDSINSQRSEIEARRTADQEAVATSADMARQSFNQEINAINETSSARIDALNSEIQSANSAADAHRAYAGEMRSLASTLIDASNGLSLSNRRARAQGGLSSALAAARRGDFSQAQSLDLSGLSDTRGQFSTASELALDVARTQTQLDELARLSGGKASAEERAASASESIVKRLEYQIEIEQASAAEQVKALEDQMNALLGIDTSVLNLDDAIRAYTEAQTALADARFDDLLSALDGQEQAANDALSQAESAYNDQISSLDQMLENAQAQVDAAYGIDNSVQSVRDSIDLLFLSVDDYNAEILARAANDSEMQSEAINIARSTNEKQVEMLASLNRMEESQRAADQAIAKHTSSTAASLDRLVRNGIEILEV